MADEKEKNDSDFDDMDWSKPHGEIEMLSHEDMQKFLSEIGESPTLEFPQEDFSKLLEEIDNPPLPESDSDAAFLQQLLDELSSPSSELNFDFDSSLEVLASTTKDTEVKPLPEPDPNLTISDVVSWMKGYVEASGALSQQYAVSYIRSHFGQRFLYRNENGNPAISRDVLKEFFKQTFMTIVWNRSERFWRLRRSNDDPKYRMVDD